MADAKKSEAEERLEYRKKPDYIGYEDYTPSGRVALRKYNEEAQKADDIVRPKRGPAYSPSAAQKAQAAQREAAAEIKRETRGKVPEGEYARGGYVKAADGIAQRGKTKGRII